MSFPALILVILLFPGPAVVAVNCICMKNALYLGSVFGTCIRVHWTFLFPVAWAFAAHLHVGVKWTSVAWIAAFVIIILVSVAMQEFTHAAIAKRCGLSTTSIILLPIGGIAQLDGKFGRPQDELFVAVGGPVVNILVALLMLPFVDVQSIFDPPAIGNLSFSVFSHSFFIVNLWLGILNLLPAYPLDGAIALRALFAIQLGYNRATRVVSVISRLAGALVFIAGVLFKPILIFVGLFVFISGQYAADKAAR